MSLDENQVAVLIKQITTQIISAQQQVLYTEQNILPIQYINNYLTGTTQIENLGVMMTYGTNELINNITTYKNKVDKITLSLFDQDYYDYGRQYAIQDNQFIVRRNGQIIFDDIKFSDISEHFTLAQFPSIQPSSVIYCNSSGNYSSGSLPGYCIQSSSLQPNRINPDVNDTKVLIVDPTQNVLFSKITGEYITDHSVDIIQKCGLTSNLPLINQYKFIVQNHGGELQNLYINDVVQDLNITNLSNWPSGILIGNNNVLQSIQYVTNDFIQDNSISGNKIISLDFSKIQNFSLSGTSLNDGSISISKLSNPSSYVNQILSLNSSGQYQISKIQNDFFTSNSISGSVISDSSIPLSKIQSTTPNRILATDISGNITLLTQLTSQNIPNNTISSAMLVSGTLVNSNISSSANISLSKINFGNTPNQGKVFTDTLTFQQISFNNISSVLDVNTQISDKSINVQKIQDTQTPYQVLVTDSSGNVGFSTGLNTNYINAQSISGSQIINQTITASQIANQTITASKISNQTITNDQIANGAQIDISKLNLYAPNNPNYFFNGNSTWVPVPSASFPQYTGSSAQFMAIGTNLIKYWTNDLNSVCSNSNLTYSKLVPGNINQYLATDQNGDVNWIDISTLISIITSRSLNINTLNPGSNGQNINTLMYNDGTGTSITYSNAFNLTQCNAFFASQSIDISKINTGITSQYLVANSSQNIIGQTGIPINDITNNGNLTNDQLVIFNKTTALTSFMSYPNQASYLTFNSNTISWSNIPKILNITNPSSAGNYFVYWDDNSQIYMTTSNINSYISNNQIAVSKIQSTGSLYDSLLVSYSNGTSAWTSQQTNAFLYFDNNSVTQYLTGTNGTAKFPYFTSSSTIGTTADATQFISSGGLNINKIANNGSTQSFLSNSSSTISWATDCTPFIASGSIAFSKLTNVSSVCFLAADKGDTSLSLKGNADITQDALYYMKYTSASVQGWFNLTGNNQLLYFNSSGSLSKQTGTSQFPYFNGSSNISVTSDATQFIGTNALSISKIAGNGATSAFLQSTATNTISWATDCTPFIASGSIALSQITNNGVTSAYLRSASSALSWQTSGAEAFIASGALSISKIANNGATQSFLSNASSIISWATDCTSFIASNALNISKIAGNGATSAFLQSAATNTITWSTDCTSFIGTNALNISKIAGNGATSAYLKSAATNSISWSTSGVESFITAAGITLSMISNNGATSAYLRSASSALSWQTSGAEAFIASGALTISKIANNGATQSFLSNASSTISWATDCTPFIASNAIALSKLAQSSGFSLLGTNSGGGNISALYSSTVTSDSLFYMKQSTGNWTAFNYGNNQGYISFQSGGVLSLLYGNNIIPTTNNSGGVNSYVMSASTLLCTNSSSQLSSIAFSSSNNGQLLGITSGALSWIDTRFKNNQTTGQFEFQKPTQFNIGSGYVTSLCAATSASSTYSELNYQLIGGRHDNNCMEIFTFNTSTLGGNGCIEFNIFSGGTVFTATTSSTIAYIDCSGNYHQVSDQTRKCIKGKYCHENVLDDLDNVNLYDYSYDWDGGEKKNMQVGVLWQELINTKYFSRICSYSNDKVKTINTGQIPMLLLGAVKELNRRIQRQKQINIDQQKQIDDQAIQIQQMKQRMDKYDQYFANLI